MSDDGAILLSHIQNLSEQSILLLVDYGNILVNVLCVKEFQNERTKIEEREIGSACSGCRHRVVRVERLTQSSPSFSLMSDRSGGYD